MKQENPIIGQVFDAVKAVTGIERSVIASGIRIREIYYARMIAAHQLKKRGYNVAEIALLVGVGDPSTVYYQLKGYAEEQTPYFRRRAEEVDQKLNGHE